MPVLVGLFGILWGFFIHANLRWRFGPLEWLISTPAFHHWHHTLNGPINRNYASTLPWLDWIFGTYYLPKDFPEAYGIEARLPESLLGQLAYPWLAQPAVARLGGGRRGNSGDRVSHEFERRPGHERQDGGSSIVVHRGTW